MDKDWRNFDVSPGSRAEGEGGGGRGVLAPWRIQNSVCTNIVMLHIKSKVMKSRIEWCKNLEEE